MALREGFRRVRLIGKIILAAGLLLDAFLLVGFVAAGFGKHIQVFALGYFGVPATILGAIILLAAWVAEGFISRAYPAGRQTPQSPGHPPAN
ncbi:MAG: hypothetical protein WCC14_00625 [Acidobacteriaceae bacterium]